MLGPLDASAVPTDGMNIVRNPGAKVFLPSENEWYKAAYYNGETGLYADYPTGSNYIVEVGGDRGWPNSDQPPGASGMLSNVANVYNYVAADAGYNDGYAVTGSTTFDNSKNYLTDVGAYTGAPSVYGTFDQGGNVREWNEMAYDDRFRGIRGGAWNSQSRDELRASFRSFDYPGANGGGLGFRVASIPEPRSSVMALLAAVGFCGLRRGRR